MHIGSDFFKILDFIMAVLRMFAEIFGDDDEQSESKDAK